MLPIELLPIVTDEMRSSYCDAVIRLLRRMMPSTNIDSDLADKIKKELPLIKMCDLKEFPGHLSICLLCERSSNATKFFYDMIHQWLLPGKRLKIELFFATDFTLSQAKQGSYTIAEVVIPVATLEEGQLIKRNFALVAREISLGVSSVFQANRIMGMKGLSIDQKTSLIQERLTTIFEKMPGHYVTDLFIQMQKFLVSTPEIYKGIRDYMHLSRMIYLFYLLQKRSKEKKEAHPQGRHMTIKIIPLMLQLPLGMKRAIGIFVSFNFLRENEVFQKRHFERALMQYDNRLLVNSDSFLSFEKREDRILTTYLEVAHPEGESFSLDERIRLTTQLPQIIQANIEKPLRAVFMPRNEEEVMRNIVILSGQLKFVRDIPQVIISFNEQREDELFFTLIVVHLQKEGRESLEDLLKGHPIFKVERFRKVGMLGKKNKVPKIAAVICASLNQSTFLRPDFTLNLYEARQFLLEELQKVIGEVRDYNGGMISKQNELFLSLQNSLGGLAEDNRLLLENFFHSIFPIELRSILRKEPLKTLFLMLKDQLGRTEFSEFCDEKNTFFLIGLKSETQAECIIEALSEVPIGRLQLARLQLQYFEIYYLGFILFSNEAEKITALKEAIESVYTHQMGE